MATDCSRASVSVRGTFHGDMSLHYLRRLYEYLTSDYYQVMSEDDFFWILWWLVVFLLVRWLRSRNAR